jgi:hypothetical protein
MACLDLFLPALLRFRLADPGGNQGVRVFWNANDRRRRQ